MFSRKTTPAPQRDLPKFSVLADISRGLNLIETPDQLCSYLCRQIKTIVGKGYFIVSLMDESGRSQTIKAIEGLNDQGLIGSILTTLGADPRSMEFDVKHATENELAVFRSGNLTPVPNGIYILVTRRFPQAACRAVEKLLGVKYVYTVGFMHDSRHFGGLTLLTASSEEIESNRDLIEAVMSQCSLILNRMFTENQLRASQKTLAESEMAIKAIMDSTPNLIWSVEPVNFGLLKFNHGLREYFLDQRGMVISPGMRPEDLFPTRDYIDNWRRFYLRALGEGTFTSEYLAYSGRTILKLAFNLLESDGKVFGISVFGEDITKRKKAEEALLKSENELKMAQRFSGIGGWEWNIKDDTLTWTDQMYTIFGLTKEKVSGGLGDVLAKAIHPEDRKKIEKASLSVINESKPVPMEYRVIWPDKSVHWVWAQAGELLHDENGKPSLLKGYAQDITRRKQDEESRLEFERKIHNAARLASIGEMASGVAHEINNPLTPVLLFTELLMKRELPEDIKSDLKLIHHSAKRAAEVTKRMLTFARHNKPTRVPCDINEIIETTLELRDYNLVQNKVEVVTDLNTTLPSIIGDPNQLQQVVLNLVLNAEHAVMQQPKNRKIIIVTGKHDNNIILSVKDNGPGILKENMVKLFTPFFTTKNSGEGTGLGLSVCHGIVAEHNGRIFAESEPGTLTAFTVELPIKSQTQDQHEEPPQNPPIGLAPKTNILVVDDESSIILVLNRILDQAGYRVCSAGTAQEALENINKQTYPIILVDVRLPDMTGIELYNKLVLDNNPVYNNIIFITGNVMDSDTMGFFAKVHAPYIAKPFDTDQLLRAVANKLAHV